MQIKPYLIAPFIIWIATNLVLLLIYRDWSKFWPSSGGGGTCIPMSWIFLFYLFEVITCSIVLYFTFPRHTSAKLSRAYINFGVLGPLKFAALLFAISIGNNTLPCVPNMKERDEQLLKTPIAIFTLIGIVFAILETFALLFIFKDSRENSCREPIITVAVSDDDFTVSDTDK